MLLQAFDFLKLHERAGCSLQIGGSDQWGNMCSGADLVRRKHGEQVFALTLPLLTTSEGEKFGKTAKGAIWLDANLTSPWEFFQFWLNTSDADVISWLKLFTFKSQHEIELLELNTAQFPAARAAQRLLAEEMTALVHGAETSTQMAQAAGVLFSRQAGIETLSLETLETLARATLTLQVKRGEANRLNALLVKTALEPSMAKANQSIRQSAAVSVNGKPQMASEFEPAEGDWLHGRFLLLRKGKKSFAFVERVG